MADAIGISSGILAFLTVSAKLTTILYSVWDDFTEAPTEIRDIALRIEQLNFYLKQVQKEEQELNAAGLTCQSISEFANIWTSLHVQLREVTVEFQDFWERLKRRHDTREIWSRADWVIRNKKRTLEFDRKISGHLETFKTIWNLITQ
ncbi:hypothetical protein Q9L58_005250 [Maublancomyces gigas]|uniref:Fungal N-terminal domain-containing protein n=1 Tax=Discina gigas TaxID=1032678 RepID=A0ABR3GJU8_9PEZI